MINNVVIVVGFVPCYSLCCVLQTHARIYSSSALLELHKIGPGDHDRVCAAPLCRHSGLNSLILKQDVHNRVLLFCLNKLHVLS